MTARDIGAGGLARDDGPLDRVERRYDGYVFDLDGTLYLGETLLPGARDAVLALRADA